MRDAVAVRDAGAVVREAAARDAAVWRVDAAAPRDGAAAAVRAAAARARVDAVEPELPELVRRMLALAAVAAARDEVRGSGRVGATALARGTFKPVVLSASDGPDTERLAGGGTLGDDGSLRFSPIPMLDAVVEAKGGAARAGTGMPDPAAAAALPVVAAGIVDASRRGRRDVGGWGEWDKYGARRLALTTFSCSSDMVDGEEERWESVLPKVSSMLVAAVVVVQSCCAC